MSNLRIKIWPDSDGTCELEAQVESNGFTGRSRAYFDLMELKNFARSLKEFPLSQRPPHAISGGFWHPTEKRIEQVHVKILIKPYDLKGTLIVHTELQTECRRSPDQELQQAVTTRFRSSYAAVGRFAESLERLIDGQTVEAVLNSRVDGNL